MRRTGLCVALHCSPYSVSAAGAAVPDLLAFWCFVRFTDTTVAIALEQLQGVYSSAVHILLERAAREYARSNVC